MYDPREVPATSNTSSTLIGFTLGAIVGAGLALLLAPDSGKRTREYLASTARRSGKMAEDAVDQARASAIALGSDVKSAVKAGQDSFAHDRAAR